MATGRLRKLAGTIFSKYNSSQRQSPALIGSRKFANKSTSLESEKLDVPLKYSGSKAQTWRAQQTRTGYTDSNEPWFQPYVIMASTAIFMIYFCILREENDIDKKFDQTLYDHIEGLEEKQIEQALEFNRAHGIETKALEERLKEIRGH